MFLIIDTILISSCILSIVNFKWGFFLYLLLGFIIPGFVYFTLGGVTININDLLLLSLMLSFLLHKKYLRKDFTNLQIRKLLSVYVISTLLLTFFASYVPFSTQFYGFVKGTLFHEAMPIIFAFYAFSDAKLDDFIINKVLIWLVIFIGFYGVFCYITNENPYIKIINLLYLNEYRFEYFLTEIRGGLSGRVSGTTNHPLTWGQLWGILLAFFVVNKNKIKHTQFMIIAILSCLNILFSGSRTALISLFPVIICYIMSNGRIKKNAYRSVLLVFLLVGISVILPNNIQIYIKSAVFFWDETISNKAEINGSNVGMRIEQLNTTLSDVAKENLIAGYGLGYREYATIKNVRNEDMLGFESIVFSKMYEQGLIGLICFFLYLFQFYSLGIKTISKNKRLLFTGYFLSYILSILFTGNQNSLNWFVFLGLLIIVSEKSDEIYKCHNKLMNNLNI